jgi:hypothetical protein
MLGPQDALSFGHSDILMLQSGPIPIPFSLYHVNPSKEQGFRTIYSMYLNLYSSTEIHTHLST